MVVTIAIQNTWMTQYAIHCKTASEDDITTVEQGESLAVHPLLLKSESETGTETWEKHSNKSINLTYKTPIGTTQMSCTLNNDGWYPRCSDCVKHKTSLLPAYGPT